MAHVLVDDLDHTVHSEKTPVRKWQFSFGPADGKMTTYSIDLTEENYMALQNALAKFVDVATEEVEAPKPPKSVGGSKSTSTSSLNKYGYEASEVREWAIKNGKTGKTGKPITEKSTRLAQELYDEYKKGQGK